MSTEAQPSALDTKPDPRTYSARMSAADPQTTKARILAVDDSRLIQRTMLKMLGNEFDVIVADDGIHAWSVLESDPNIQVVFSDLNMPRMDGFELLRMIRTAADTGVRNLPVIIVSGAEDDEGMRIEALECGATDFVTKPFASVDLLARARAHANYQRVTQALRAASTLDPLTSLANKQGFLERLTQDIAYARRHEQPLAVACIEIEGFHTLFLRYGKETAEGLVTLVGRLVRASIRKEDTAGRIGLGGFALSLPGGQEQGVEGMIDRLRSEVLAQSAQIEVMPVPVELKAAVIGVDSTNGPPAGEVLDACIAKMGPVRRSAAAEPAPRPPAAGGLPPVPVPPPKAPPTPSMPKTEPAPVALRIDPLLDQLVESGDPRGVAERVPQILTRLVPLFKLLNPKQRQQLIAFLQKLGA